MELGEPIKRLELCSAKIAIGIDLSTCKPPCRRRAQNCFQLVQNCELCLVTRESAGGRERD